jgi:PAS domain S-box-containing protein
MVLKHEWKQRIKTPLSSLVGSSLKSLDEMEPKGSETRFLTVFKAVPLPILVEDFSGVQARFDELRSAGVTDLRVHLESHQEELLNLASRVRILDANPACLAMLGAMGKDELTHTLPKLLPESSYVAFREEMAVLFEGRTTFESEITNRELGGRVLHVILHLAVLPGHETTLDRVLISFLDITERKKVEEAWKQSAAQLRTLVDTLPDLVWVKDPDGVYLACNPRFECFFGAKEKDIIGKTDHDFVDRELADSFRKYDRRAMAAGKQMSNEERITFADDGHEEYIETIKTPIFGTGREILGVLGIGRDITLHKQAEETLKEREFLLRESQRVAGIGSYKLDFTNNSWKSSEGLDEIFGIDESYTRDVRGWRDIIHPDDRAMMDRYVREEVIAGGKPFLKVYRIIRRNDHETRWVKGLGEVKFDSDGNVQSLIGTVQDITQHMQAREEKAKLQARLLQAQKMESLGILAGGVAHDMNNVLGAILTMASASLEAQPADSPAYRAFKTIVQAANRGGKMVKSLLSFARQSPAEERVLVFNAIILEGVQLLERTTMSRVSLKLDLEPELRPILGDPSALANAFMNIGVNAVDAMPENGTLTLRTRNLDQDWIEVLVEDTGTGMSREVLEKAMEPFFTTKPVGKGTGLGLSMVFSTVKAHYGYMDIESNPGQGTSIRMRFPACAAEAQASEPALESLPEPSPKVPTILLVDDDEMVRCSIKEALEILGYGVQAVMSGEEALTELESGFQPDVMILDMNMPGLGGSGTLPRLRVLCPTLPVLLATGRADQAALDLIEAFPFVTLLSKPFSMRELKKQLEILGRG